MSPHYERVYGFGDNLNGPGAAETAPDQASPFTPGADMPDDTPFPHGRKSEAR